MASQTQAHTIGLLGDIPLLVLTAENYTRSAPPGDASAVRMQKLWHAMHRAWVEQSSNAQQILVETSGHFIQREQPEVVATAIRQMVETIRATGDSSG